MIQPCYIDLEQARQLLLGMGIELTGYYINRINDTQDTISAVNTINPHAMEYAARLDKDRIEGRRSNVCCS